MSVARSTASLFAFALSVFVAPVVARTSEPGWLGIAHALAAAPQGTSVDFTPHGTQPGLIHSLAQPDECGTCHAGESVAQQAFRPYSSWSGSMMANATRDPLFWAALDVANHDVPGSGDYCLRCHTSQGWYGGRVVKPGFGGPDNDIATGAAGCLLQGGYDQGDYDNDYSGVSCHFCHRLMAQGPGGETASLDNANAWVDDGSCGGDFEPCRRGPYDYTSGGPPHVWSYSALHTQSTLCATCHNVSSPDTADGPLKTLKLADGTDTGMTFPVERTFSEWEQSHYAQSPQQTCQACHMPDSEAPDASACSLGGYPNRTGDLPVHEFAGGNTWIPKIVSGQYGEGIAIDSGRDRTQAYAQSIEWARQMLLSAASVDTTLGTYAPPTSGGAGSLAVHVKVTNLSGHKLPTGYAEGRRMWLNLQVKAANGSLVFESGAYDPATALLVPDPQLRVYETLQGIWNHHGDGECDVEDAGGKAMFHFILNDCVAKDNRIPPLGFKPATAGDPNGYSTRPVGASYPETSPGSGILVNYDVVDYTAALPAGAVGPFTATARLYYQTSSRDYIEFLRDEAVSNATPSENTMCAAGPGRPFTTGPQSLSRGEYAYGLWSGAVGDKVFRDGFDGDGGSGAYGKSPPELMQSGAASTP